MTAFIASINLVHVKLVPHEIADNNLHVVEDVLCRFKSTELKLDSERVLRNHLCIYMHDDINIILV